MLNAKCLMQENIGASNWKMNRTLQILCKSMLKISSGSCFSSIQRLVIQQVHQKMNEHRANVIDTRQLVPVGIQDTFAVLFKIGGRLINLSHLSEKHTI